MAFRVLPWAIQGQSHDAAVTRSASAAVFGVPVAAHTPGLSVTTAGGGHGVVLPGDMLVSQNGTPNMGVSIAAGRAVVRSGRAGNISDGVYTDIINDAPVSVSVTAAHATLPRKDLVIAQVRDTNYGEAASDARPLVVAGTPAASPADPDLTGYPNCLVLARISVAAAASSITNANIADLRTWVSAIGGRRRVHSTYRPTGASLYAGLEIFEHDTGRNLQYDGTGWVIQSEPTNAITAAVKQNNVALTTTTLRAEYSRDRDMVDAFFSIQISSAGTTATELKVTPTGLPAPGSNRGPGVGTWWYVDAGANYYAGVVDWDGVDIHFVSHGNGQYLGIAPSFAAASGDQIVCALRYRT